MEERRVQKWHARRLKTQKSTHSTIPTPLSPTCQSFTQHMIYQSFHLAFETYGAAYNDVINSSNLTNHASAYIIQLIHTHTL
jgi:hypothetical protein